MKTYSTNQLRKIIKGIPSDAKPPSEYGKVFNKYYGDSLGGAAWIMWFLDYLDDKPSIAIPQEEKFPYEVSTT